MNTTEKIGWSILCVVVAWIIVFLSCAAFMPKTFEGYYLYRADEENGLYNRLTIDPVDKATTIFIDTGLEDGKPYYFKVTCVDAVPNESPPSEVANGTPQDTVAPDAPIGLFANTLPEGNTISLTWDPNTESDLEGYSILRGETPFALNWIADVSAGTTSYIDTTLTDGITYYYKIRAFDEVPNFSDLSLHFSID